ncbi:ASCH domain-containing protein [Burkholderia glumae]|uniref:ASCH domain-containing protein n=1 Tax=Burkholderia glumae TaxID=337 RepID=UPI00214FE893|nr:ASCH domain-containing protein [Burkholderia glumae]
MKALSIRQPWAWLIVRPDITDLTAREAARRAGLIKDIENRTWPTRYRGPLLIHAGKSMTRDEYEDVEWFLDTTPIELPPAAQLERGGIIGVAKLVDCVAPRARTSPWHMEGQHGFLLHDARPVPFLPYKGQLGIFEVPDDVGALP